MGRAETEMHALPGSEVEWQAAAQFQQWGNSFMQAQCSLHCNLVQMEVCISSSLFRAWTSNKLKAKSAGLPAIGGESPAARTGRLREHAEVSSPNITEQTGSQFRLRPLLEAVTDTQPAVHLCPDQSWANRKKGAVIWMDRWIPA